MIVADTNPIAYLLLDGTGTASAREVLRLDPEWAAPYLWRSEMRSVLGQYLQDGELTLPDALLIQRKAEQFLRGRVFLVKSDSVLSLVAESSCSANDCEFVALARQLRVPLVTSDRRILAAFPAVASDLDGYANNGR